MLGRIQIAVGTAIAVAIGLSFAAAQNTAASPSTVQVEPAKYAVEVEVFDEGGVLVYNANVRLTNLVTKEELTAVTDSIGQVRFSGRPAGNYVVRVDAKGFRTEIVPLGVPTQGIVRVSLALGRSGGPTPICSSCGVPTTASSLEDQLPPDPSPTPNPPVPHRNPVARFFSRIGHKLGL